MGDAWIFDEEGYVAIYDYHQCLNLYRIASHTGRAHLMHNIFIIKSNSIHCLASLPAFLNTMPTTSFKA